MGLVAVNTKATANEVKIVTSYDGAVNAFGQGTMAELIRLALKNGAGSVAAVPIASGEGYGDGFAALEGLEDVTAVICDSTDGDVQKAMKESVETASANRRERIAVAAGGAEETVDELIARARPEPRAGGAGGPRRRGQERGEYGRLRRGGGGGRSHCPGRATPPCPWAGRCSLACMV